MSYKLWALRWNIFYFITLNIGQNMKISYSEQYLFVLRKMSWNTNQILGTFTKCLITSLILAQFLYNLYILVEEKLLIPMMFSILLYPLWLLSNCVYKMGKKCAKNDGKRDVIVCNCYMLSLWRHYTKWRHATSDCFCWSQSHILIHFWQHMTLMVKKNVTST